MQTITTKEDCLAAMLIDGDKFHALPPNFQNDIDIVKYALTATFPVAFTDIPLPFQNDKTLALLAAQQPEVRLWDFPKHFQTDIEIVRASIKTDPINYLVTKDNDFNKNKEIILLALQGRFSGSSSNVQNVIDVIAFDLGVIIAQTSFEKGKRPQAPSLTESTQQELLALTQHLITLDQHRAMKEDRTKYMNKLNVNGQAPEAIKKPKFRSPL